jgi:diaminohydroxyphosphoribosylaminopyrimidine deaminase/5-amino-6-(5-phosphoribosylamino)uracil reductase
MRFSPHDKRWMRRTLVLASKALGKTRPNPVVGTVIVKNGEVVGEGYHRAAGKPHAEVNALRRAGAAARGATLYVNLEPCCHQGRTPPCTDRIIQAGIARVVIALRDPNPLVGGKGIARLREAGIRVDLGLLEHEATHLNQPFLTFHRFGRPFVVAKWALTLDGRLRAISGDSHWISNERSRRYVHEMRARYDSIMVGIGTVITDDPRLNARLPGKRRVIQPTRIVVDGYLRTPGKARCIDPTNAGPTIIATTDSAPPQRIEQMREKGITVFVCPGNKAIVDLHELFKALHTLDIQSVLVEGGQQLLSSLFEADLADRVVAFFAPKIAGGDEGRHVLTGWGVHRMHEAIDLHDVEIRHFGEDVCVEGYVRKHFEALRRRARSKTRKS